MTINEMITTTITAIINYMTMISYLSRDRRQNLYSLTQLQPFQSVVVGVPNVSLLKKRHKDIHCSRHLLSSSSTSSRRRHHKEAREINHQELIRASD